LIYRKYEFIKRSDNNTQLIKPTIFNIRFSGRENKLMMANPVMINEAINETVWTGDIIGKIQSCCPIAGSRILALHRQVACCFPTVR